MGKSHYERLKTVINKVCSEYDSDFIPMMRVKREIMMEFGVNPRTVKAYMDAIKILGLLEPHRSANGFYNPFFVKSPEEEVEKLNKAILKENKTKTSKKHTEKRHKTHRGKSG